MIEADARALLTGLFDAAVTAARPEHCLGAVLPVIFPDAPKGRVVVIGAGKASAAMARAFEQQWPGPLEGLVVTRYGHAVACERIEVVEAAHPVPDAAGERAAKRLLSLVENLGADDLVVCLISGGGSALLPLPQAGISLAEKQQVGRALLRSGASIAEINCVRRHLSAIKGGRLAAACYPAKVVNLLISDVPGDAPTDIASGPTVGDATCCDDALAIVQRYNIELSVSAQHLLESGAGESVKPNDPRLARVETHLIATPQQSLEAAAAVARKAGITPLILGDSLEGEARDVGCVLAGIALQVRAHQQPLAAPCVLLSGGETSVTVRGNGRGGRNVECLLSMAQTLRAAPNVYALCADTDGVDGEEDIAGALVTPSTLQRAFEQGLSPQTFLDNNDAHHFFELLGDSLITGPTCTNVNDFRALLIL